MIANTIILADTSVSRACDEDYRIGPIVNTGALTSHVLPSTRRGG
jgi:hypothetical protein